MFAEEFETYIPVEYLEGIAEKYEVTVDYLLDEFVIDGQLEFASLVYSVGS